MVCCGVVKRILFVGAGADCIWHRLDVVSDLLVADTVKTAQLSVLQSELIAVIRVDLVVVNIRNDRHRLHWLEDLLCPCEFRPRQPRFEWLRYAWLGSDSFRKTGKKYQNPRHRSQ